MPSVCKSPITAGAELIQKLEQIPGQKINSLSRCVVTIGSFNSGEIGSVIPEKADLSGTIRFFDNITIDLIKKEVERNCKGIAESNDVKIDVTFENHGLVTINDDKLTNEIVIPSLKDKFHIVTEGLPVSGSEDFSSYQVKIPGVYIFLGGGDDDHKIMLHHPKYDFNDKIIPLGVKIYIGILEQRLGIKITDII